MEKAIRTRAGRPERTREEGGGREEKSDESGPETAFRPEEKGNSGEVEEKE
jgi:hypothetical protein